MFKFPKLPGNPTALIVVSGVVANLNQTADPSDNSTSEWAKKRKVPGIEVAFMGGSVRGVLMNPEAKVGVGAPVTVACSARLFQGSFSPNAVYVLEVEGKPTGINSAA